MFPGVSKRDKLLAKLMNGRSDRSFTFDEVELVLLQAGFLLDGGKGSHRVYRHEDGRKMVLPRHGNTIKPIYVKKLREILQ